MKRRAGPPWRVAAFALPAFLNLCPRMPLVMPICDAFEPVNRAARNFDTAVHHTTRRESRHRRNVRDLGPFADIYVMSFECKFVPLPCFRGRVPFQRNSRLTFKMRVSHT